MNSDSLRLLLTDPGRDLLAELAADDAPYDAEAALATATRLRRSYPADVVAAALTQARLRDRARAKFGAAAAGMYFTPVGLEQSTRASVAEHRAARYAAAGVRRVADLCCGIGADMLAFARAGIEVLAVDRDPDTCAVAAANAAAAGLGSRTTVRCANVTGLGPADLAGCDAVFVDPARRSDRGRVFDPRTYSPPWSFLLELTERADAVGFKVAPGIPHALVPPGAEAEWVSDTGDVKEAGIYVGRVAAAGVARKATLLPSGAGLVSEGCGDPAVGAPGAYLYEPDGAVIRAHLLGELAGRLGATLIDPTIAYLTSDRLSATPYATAYRVTDVLPFGLKRLRALVRERGIGTLTVKKRGSAIDPERLRAQLKPAGPASAVLIVTRVAGEPTAFFAQRPGNAPSAGGIVQ